MPVEKHAQDLNHDQSRNTSILPPDSSVMATSKLENYNGIHKGEASVLVVQSEAAHALTRMASSQPGVGTDGQTPIMERSRDEAEDERWKEEGELGDDAGGIMIGQNQIRTSQRDQNYRSQ